MDGMGWDGMVPEWLLKDVCLFYRTKKVEEADPLIMEATRRDASVV